MRCPCYSHEPGAIECSMPPSPSCGTGKAWPSLSLEIVAVIVQQTVEDARAVLEDAGSSPLPATKQSVQQMLAYAHRLGYSSFLPLLGEHLVEAGVAQHFRPSLAHLQNSHLKHSAMYVPAPAPAGHPPAA